MQRQYPFHADAAGAVTIYHPLTKTAITTLPFDEGMTMQKLMGVSVSSDADVFLNNLRIRIGSSLPDYRYIDIPVNGHNNADEVLGHCPIVNYYDLGGQEIYEGDILTLTFVTGTFLSGVLYVDDMNGQDPPIPQGNLVNLHFAGLSDYDTSWASETIDTRKLENNRLYSVFKTIALPEGSAAVSIEGNILQCGKRTLAIPMDTMVWDRTPFQFTGLEWNNGQVLLYGQAEAAEKCDLHVYCMESAIPGNPGKTTGNAPPIGSTTPSNTPGILSIPVKGGSGGGLIQRTSGVNVFARK